MEVCGVKLPSRLVRRVREKATTYTHTHTHTHAHAHTYTHTHTHTHTCKQAHMTVVDTADQSHIGKQTHNRKEGLCRFYDLYNLLWTLLFRKRPVLTSSLTHCAVSLVPAGRGTRSTETGSRSHVQMLIQLPPRRPNVHHACPVGRVYSLMVSLQ